MGVDIRFQKILEGKPPSRSSHIPVCTMLGYTLVLIPKGGGDYCSIRLLEPIWKVIEWVIDRKLDSIQLQDSLHGYQHQRGTVTAMIEAKLAHQLSYLEMQLFYGVFLGLRKAFDAMDWERCLMILGGYGAGPPMVQLICGFW
jgi:hypothetical protein